MKLRHAILEALGECHQEKVKAVVKEEKRLDCFEAKDKDWLTVLADKGNKYAAYELYHKYMWGDEEHGIFISKENAKPYFDLAIQRGYEFNDEELNELNEPDEPGEECPEGFRYTLTGDSSTLQAVHTLIDDLCQRFGTPGNELGLYVPQRMLMKVLVGSDTEYYRGNVITMTQEAPDRLIIETEADSGEPLLYALRCSFPNIEVEMEEYELF